MSVPKTLYQKLIDSHTIQELDQEGNVLLYIDRSILNEYTSPQAFSGLREKNRKPVRPERTLLNIDHVNPTRPERTMAMTDPGGEQQANYFRKNSQDFGLELFDMLDERQGIEHVVATEQGFILPGMVVAAGDSHTTTYGALGAFGFGIGTSEIEHYLATQTLVYKYLKSMRVTVTGQPSQDITSKDIIMALIAQIGADGATGFAIEFTGSAIWSMSVEARMTICNMAVEAGARGAFMAPDEKVYAYLKTTPRAPQGHLWQQAVTHWQTLFSDENALFDQDITLDITQLSPIVTWGISPDQALGIDQLVPDPALERDTRKALTMQKALDYMALTPNTPLVDIKITHAFIGSCTNGRIEDLRAAAQVAKGKMVATHVRAMVIPGSTLVRMQAEREGLAQVFIDAGFEWRQSGCSMCLAMNEDVLKPNDRCASSTNRNFAGRQGAGSRTHLMSPTMVVAAAITGYLTDVRSIKESA